MASLIGELQNEYHKAQWLGHFDAKVASVVLEAKSVATCASLSRAIGVHVTAMCGRLAKLLGEARGGTEKVQAAASKHVPGLVEWLAAAADSGTTSALAENEVLPKVINYDADGQPIDTQVEMFKQDEPPRIFLWLPGLGCVTWGTHTPRRVPGAS